MNAARPVVDVVEPLQKNGVYPLSLLITPPTMSLKAFGKIPDGARQARIENSPNYKAGIFQNAEPTEAMLKSASLPNIMWKQFNKPKTTAPPKPVPTVKTDLKNLLSDEPMIVWFGHSSYLITSRNFKILVDPVFSGYAAPFSFVGKCFPGANPYAVEDFPEIDLLVLTHDHYDHLDYETIIKLKNKVKRIVTPLA